MQKTTNFILWSLLLMLLSCSSVKTTQKALNSGDYNKVIAKSIDKLRKDKSKDKNEPFIHMLSNAYKKLVDKHSDRISFLKKTNNPDDLKTIYDSYLRLDALQNKIKPLLPLNIYSTGKNAAFKMQNYDDEIISYKEQLSEHLYAKGLDIFDSANGNKLAYREAFNQFKYLNNINSNYKDTEALLEEAHFRGTDFVHVTVKNRTRQFMPRRLEQDLLNIDTYGLNDLWTVYHAIKDKNLNYDFDLELNLTRINVSPERITEREYIRERRIKDGYKYQRDRRGNIVKDSLGNSIKIDKYIQTRCRVFEVRQFKACNVVGQVQYKDNNSRKLMRSFPISSEFYFDNIFGDFEGDEQALLQEDYALLNCRRLPFPSNEQMVYDTGTDLKEKLKNIIVRNKFRR